MWVRLVSNGTSNVDQDDLNPTLVYFQTFNVEESQKIACNMVQEPDNGSVIYVVDESYLPR